MSPDPVADHEPVERDRNGLEILDRSECLALLDATGFGRVGLISGRVPMILPVTFVMVGGDPVFRSVRGTKLAAIGRGQVCLEIDGNDSVDHSGWSVLVLGRPVVVKDEAELGLSGPLPLRLWVTSDYSTIVRLRAQQISGRRLRR